MNKAERGRRTDRVRGAEYRPRRSAAAERTGRRAGGPPRAGEKKKGSGDKFTAYLCMQSVVAGTILAAMLGVRLFGGELYAQIREGVSESFLSTFDVEQAGRRILDRAEETPVFRSLFGSKYADAAGDEGGESAPNKESGAESVPDKEGGESAPGESTPDESVPGESVPGESTPGESASEKEGASDEKDASSTDGAAQENAGAGGFMSVAAGAGEGIADGEVFRSLFYAAEGDLPYAGAGAPYALPERLIAPADCSEITSEYGYRDDPFTGESGFHSGLDIALDEGTRVNAAMSGTVAKVSEDEISGLYIVLEHEDGFKTVYAHLRETLVGEGEKVRAGQWIALSGSTGRVTGPHLHFSMLKDGDYIDPARYLYV